jgi:tRNA(Ile)-lysidine synthase
MIRHFSSFIDAHKLFLKTDRILLAVSGGLDSVVMADLFYKAGFKFGIAHCNFGLRGKESDEDEAFTRKLAEKKRVPFFVRRFDTSAYAALNKISVQMAARELRYEWFEQIRVSEKFSFIATAHHLDDQLETFLINMIRGTGISGFHGILPVQGTIIRPMMFAFRKEIAEYAKENRIRFQEDSSNREDKYIRNKIRLKIIPLLEEINPDLRKTLTTEIGRLRFWEQIGRKEIEKKISELVKRQQNKTLIDLRALKNTAPAELYAWEILCKYGFNSSVVSDILASLDAKSGKTFLSPGYKAVKDRDTLIIQEFPTRQAAPGKKISGKVRSISKPVSLKFSILNNMKEISIPAGKEFASLDYNKLTFPLEIRKWQAGDSFRPFGLHGKKKVSDLLIDEKVPIPEKENTFVLCSSGKIAWVIGHRIDQRFRITSKTTRIFRIILERDDLI